MKIRPTLRAGALAEREFRRLFTGQALSVIGDGIAPIAIAFAVLDLTHSATDYRTPGLTALRLL
jgi:hypothetical protein